MIIFQIHALYGGTFDPIHYGHLKPIEILSSFIDLRHVIITPNNIPSYRPKPKASSEQRKKMLELAISDRPLFKLDKCKFICRNLPISQILKKWRNKLGSHQPIAFIVGQDSLLTIPDWYQYGTILNNSHLIVCNRPGYSYIMKEKHHQLWLEKHLTHNISDLYDLPAGKIYLAKTPKFNISSTLIRQRLKQKLPCHEMLPPKVLEYIIQHGLYQKK